jgi:signal transduction histidine kinase
VGGKRTAAKNKRSLGSEKTAREVRKLITWDVQPLILHSFIDMTSHELRNPLSAVVQCADSVIATLQHLPIEPPTTPATSANHLRLQEDISTSIDALQTIVSCSLHQKRVIDDVLTLSKLDSDLILITPM